MSRPKLIWWWLTGRLHTCQRCDMSCLIASVPCMPRRELLAKQDPTR